MSQEFRALGRSGVGARRELETFPTPEGLTRVKAINDQEVTALCPVTKQPDFYTVIIDYSPNTRCVESKSLKLYLQSFRDEGLFCEAFATRIAKDLSDALQCRVWVRVVQKARGGISLEAESVRGSKHSVSAES